MTSIQSSFFLGKTSYEWTLGDPRDFLEIGRSRSLWKESPEVEFTVPISNGNRSCPIYWFVKLFSDNQRVDNQPAFEVQVYMNTKGKSIGQSIGLKFSLIILDDSDNILTENKTYRGFTGDSAVSTTASNWPVKLEDIPPDCPFVKICCTCQAFDTTNGGIPAQTDLAQLQLASGQKLAHILHCSELVHVLDKDRQTGTSTDTVLKLGQTEYKVHKCVLSLQSDFFKTRFSDRLEARDTDTRVVDMNDSELSPELLEALICGAYTGKVENFDTAVKVLPVAHKYQFQTLKGVCERLICSQLTKKDNLLSIHLMATQCKAPELKRKCEILVDQ